MPGCSGLDEVAGAGGEGAFPRERGNTGRGLGGEVSTSGSATPRHLVMSIKTRRYELVQMDVCQSWHLDGNRSWRAGGEHGPEGNPGPRVDSERH